MKFVRVKIYLVLKIDVIELKIEIKRQALIVYIVHIQIMFIILFNSFITCHVIVISIVLCSVVLC